MWTEKYAYSPAKPKKTVKKTRVKISIMATRGRRMLIGFFSVLCLLFGAAYLFWVNHLGMQGIILSEMVQDQTKLTDKNNQLESRIAGYSATKFIAEQETVESLDVRSNPRFYVKKQSFTAQNTENAIPVNEF